MSPAHALLPGEYASGARITEVTLRPVRPACLIPDDDVNLAAQFAASRCLAWGGHASYVIPYQRTGSLSEPWTQLLELLDPDHLFALGARQRAVHDHLGGAGRLVYTQDDPAGLFVHSSTLVHSVLEAIDQYLKPPNSERFVVVPGIPEVAFTRHHYFRHYLPLLARYGGLDMEPVKRALERRYPRYSFDLNLDELVRVEGISAERFDLDALAGDLRGLLGEEEAKRALTLPDLTRMGLRVTSGPSSEKGGRESAWDMQAEYYSPVMVTGEDTSVEDFALYWNLRAEHFFAAPFPIWMPLDMLEDAEAPDIIARALDRVRPGVGATVPRMDDLLIVSASTSATELQEQLRSIYPEASFGIENFAELFATTCEYRYTTEKIPAHFERGWASIQPPRPGEFDRTLIPGADYVTYEAGVDEMWLPQSKAPRGHPEWLGPRSRDKVSKRGNLRFVKPFNQVFGEKDLLDLRTPDGWTLLSSVFEDHGYDITPTAKSKTALGQLALLGGVENLKVIASSRVHRLLKEVSLGRGEDRAFVNDRKTAPFSRFVEEWGREAGRGLLWWLIERRLLFRGAEVKCPRCELKRWYGVDRIGETWRCDGCKEDMPIPLHLPATSWHYKINELYAHGHDQGTLSPLLTLYAMYVAWGTSAISGGLGFYPGIELKAKEGADVPFENKEIDLVALRGNSLILAECKESGETLSDPTEASLFARQLGDLVVLADHLDAEQLLITSSTTFPENKESLIGEVPAGYSVELTWLDGYDLLDPNLVLHPLAHPLPTGERHNKPSGWEIGYLDWVWRSTTDRTA